jgi:DNA-binding NarL/FixJ family response regulator
MTLAEAYHSARRDERVARLRRVLALRAMVAEGMTQQQIADALGICGGPCRHVDVLIRGTQAAD